MAEVPQEKHPGGESALVVLIPEAEPLVNRFRDLYDPSAAWGVPAHVTVLYPFKPHELISQEDQIALKTMCRSFPPFHLIFSQIMEFPDTLFLAPNSPEPLIEITRAVVNQFPDYPPYGAAFNEIVPHLTVAQSEDVEEMHRIRVNFTEVAHSLLPIYSEVKEIVLMDDFNGRWEIRERFPLSSHRS